MRATYGDKIREDYYAWTWGDALFVVIDVFQYTSRISRTAPPRAKGATTPADRRPVELDPGQRAVRLAQDRPCEGSDAKYKFVFSHNVIGGITRADRRGPPATCAAGPRRPPYYEWGGKNADGN